MTSKNRYINDDPTVVETNHLLQATYTIFFNFYFYLGPQSVPSGSLPMGPKSIATECTSCGTRIHTITSKKAKSTAWWGCILMCIFG